MATDCQTFFFDQDGQKSFDSIESSDDSGKNVEVNVIHGNRNEETPETSGSDDRAFVLNVDARIMQIGEESDLSFGSVDNSVNDNGNYGPVLREHWKPEGILNVARSRIGFPDCKHDHLVQLLVCRNQHTREAVDITNKYEIVVTVAYDGISGSKLKMPDYQCKRIKGETKSGVSRSMAGVVGFLFRFLEASTKYNINFALQTALPKKRGKMNNEKHRSACETVSEISITLETGKPRKKIKERKIRKRNVPPSSELAPASLSEENMELCKRSSWVMKQLQSCRDNAKWEDFDKFSNKFLLEFLDTDTQITIILEQSVAACYRNDLERSLQLIDESFKLMPQAKNVQLLAGRGYGYLAGVKRRQRCLGEADHYVQLAEQSNRACHTNLDTSFVVYEKASVLLEFIGRTPQRSPQQVSEALRNLERCIDVCLRVELQDSDLYVKKHHFALIKIAMLLLDCRTEAARERVLSEEFIAKGQECLNALKTKYWSEIPEGVKIQFYLASSDLEYRRGNYAEAERFATLAKNKAVELGFNTEISHAQGRLYHMRAITSGARGALRNSPRLFSPTISSSEGENGDVSSSGSESDWRRILE